MYKVFARFKDTADRFNFIYLCSTEGAKIHCIHEHCATVELPDRDKMNKCVDHAFSLNSLLEVKGWFDGN